VAAKILDWQTANRPDPLADCSVRDMSGDSERNRHHNTTLSAAQNHFKRPPDAGGARGGRGAVRPLGASGCPLRNAGLASGMGAGAISGFGSISRIGSAQPHALPGIQLDFNAKRLPRRFC